MQSSQDQIKDLLRKRNFPPKQFEWLQENQPLITESGGIGSFTRRTITDGQEELVNQLEWYPGSHYEIYEVTQASFVLHWLDTTPPGRLVSRLIKISLWPACDPAVLTQILDGCLHPAGIRI